MQPQRILVPPKGKHAGQPTIDGTPQALRVVKPDLTVCHEWSARGFKTGTQGVTSTMGLEGHSTANARAVIPYALSMDVCLAAERALAHLGRKLRVLDICSGLNGWSQAFRDRGHDVVGLDIEEHLPAEIHADIRSFKGKARAMLAALLGRDFVPDIILASPPCEAFSIAGVRHMWTPLPDKKNPERYLPKHPTAILGLEILEAVQAVIAELGPAFFWIENPRAMMNKFPQMRAYQHVPITQCTYGHPVAAKATDLWGRWPTEWQPRPYCTADASGGVADSKLRIYKVHQIGKGKTKFFELEPTTTLAKPRPIEASVTIQK